MQLLVSGLGRERDALALVPHHIMASFSPGCWSSLSQHFSEHLGRTLHSSSCNPGPLWQLLLGTGGIHLCWILFKPWNLLEGICAKPGF